MYLFYRQKGNGCECNRLHKYNVFSAINNFFGIGIGEKFLFQRVLQKASGTIRFHIEKE